MRNLLIRLCFFLLICSLSLSAFAQVRVGQQRPDNNVNISYTSPKEYQIAGIETRGLLTLDANAIISITGLKVGDKIRVPGEDISQAIKRVWRNGVVSEISILITRIENENVYLLIDIKERPRLSKIIITGIKSGQKSSLNEKIGLIRGKVLTEAVLKNTQLTIKNHFSEKGFLNAKVKMKQVPDTILRNYVQLSIDIRRGAKVKINKISVEGNENFSDKTVKKKLKSTNEFPRFHLPKRLFEQITNVTPAKVKEFTDSTYKVTKPAFDEFINDNVKLNVLSPLSLIKMPTRKIS